MIVGGRNRLASLWVGPPGAASPVLKEYAVCRGPCYGPNEPITGSEWSEVRLRNIAACKGEGQWAICAWIAMGN
jgi:hypothetical protein